MTLEDLKRKTVDVANHWGDEMPVMTMEECGELIQVLSKARREGMCGELEDHILQEIRDVLICAGALMNYFDLEVEDLEEEIGIKLDMNY